MGAKHRKVLRSSDAPRNAPAPAPASRGPGQRPRLAGWRLGLARIALALLIPVVVLFTLEFTLRVLNVGYPTAYYLARPQAQIYTDNPRFIWQFYSRKTNLRPHPFALPMVKPA